MSYRTKVEGTQIFGNNEYYQQWIDAIQKAGIAIKEEGQYEGYVTEFQPLLEATEQIVLELATERQKSYENSLKEILKQRRRMQEPVTVQDILDINKETSPLFDLSFILQHATENKHPSPLLDELILYLPNTYLYLPMRLYKACKDKLETIPPNQNRWFNYQLKKGCKIHICAG